MNGSTLFIWETLDMFENSEVESFKHTMKNNLHQTINKSKGN